MTVYKGTPYYIGIDVSKATLDIHIRPSGKCETFANDTEGIVRLIGSIQSLHPERVVMEATGGFEKRAADMLTRAGLPAVVVNARQVRGFAVALGRNAKTDPIDAEVISRFAESIMPELREPPDPTEKEMAGLTRRRQQLTEQRTAEKNRLPGTDGRIRESVLRMIGVIDEEIRELEKQIENLTKSSPVMKRKSEIVQSFPGIGKTVSGVLLSGIPELGKIDGKQVSALAGLAPFNNDSGTKTGRRHVYGGRGLVRSKLYMAAVTAIRWNPAIKQFYERLLERGKAKKAALVACARKILVIVNAMVKNDSLWDGNYAKNS